MKIANQKTTVLNIGLLMALVLTACTGDNGTGRGHSGGDPDDKTDIASKSPTSEPPIGNMLANRRFVSVEKKESGFGPDGEVMGHWYLDFSSSTFEWAYSDVVESGSYVLDERQVVGRSGDRQILGEYDPNSGILTWDETDYRSVEIKE